MEGAPYRGSLEDLEEEGVSSIKGTMQRTYSGDLGTYRAGDEVELELYAARRFWLAGAFLPEDEAQITLLEERSTEQLDEETKRERLAKAASSKKGGPRRPVPATSLES